MMSARQEYAIPVVFAFAVAALVTGCVDGSDDYDDIEDRNAEIVENLLDAGFSPEDIEIRESVVMSEGSLAEPRAQVYVDGDVLITLEASRELAGEEEGESSFRLWRTPNLVNNNTTICLAKVTSAQAPYGSYVLTGAMQTGVNAAATNYAGLASFGLTFKTGDASLSSTGTLSHSIAGCTSTIFIYQVSGGAGGTSGFPSGGLPYGQVQLNSGLAGYSAGVHEHVATHEIGHAIGLRHSDWKTRSSCGQNTNEGKSGAIQITGTSNQTTNSVMAACFTSTVSGNFLGQDATALSTIY